MDEALANLVRQAVAAAIAEEGWTANDTEAIVVRDDGTWTYFGLNSRERGRWDRDPNGVHGIYIRVDA